MDSFVGKEKKTAKTPIREKNNTRQGYWQIGAILFLFFYLTTKGLIVDLRLVVRYRSRGATKECSTEVISPSWLLW